MRHQFTASIVAIGLYTVVATPALADATYSGIGKNPAGSPAVISRCSIQNNQNDSGDLVAGAGIFTILNRTTYHITSVAVRVRAFSQTSSPLGESTGLYQATENGIYANDSADVTASPVKSIIVSTHAGDIDHLVCSVTSVTFSDHSAWTYGKPFNGKLSSSVSQ